MNGLYNTVTRLCFTLWFLLSGTITLAANKPLQLTDEEQSWIKAHPELTVANEMDWAPFDYVDNSKPAGYSIDVVRLIQQKTGLQMQFINGFTWPELMQKFRAGEIDIMPAIYVNEERSKFTAFTRSYFSQPSVMVIHQDNKDITDIGSLAGKRVAGIRDFAITTTLEKIVPDITIVPVNNIIEGLKSVSLGKADAFIDSIGTVSYYLENNYIPNLRVLGKVDNNALSNPSLHIGVAKNKLLLRSILNKALASISREEKETLGKRWTHIPESTKNRVSEKIILTPEQQAWLTKHPVIRIGIDAGYAPYSFRDTDGKFIGVAPDLIALISEKSGVSFEAVPDLSWPQIVEGAQKHTLDVIATAVITEERKSFLNFTQIYIPTPLVIMSRINDVRINEASDLNKLTVALVEGYSSSKRVMDEQPAANRLMVATPIEGLHAVSSSAADAYVGVLGINIYQAQQQGITNLKVASNYDIVGNGQRFAVRSDWTELTQILERALNSISNKERKAIYDKWVSVPYVEQTDYSLFWKALTIFLAIVSLMYIHNRRLHREVGKRQAAEQELLELNKNLVKARNEADKANQAKSQFLSSMSHELRTPMNAILGFSQLLQLDLKEKQQKDHVNEIVNAGRHLLELINDVLDLSQIEAGKINLDIRDISLSSMISESLSLISSHANNRKIRIVNKISDTPDLVLRADHIRFKQVVLNLLSNAVKYNVESGQITIDYKKIADNRVRILVTDTGKGIDTEKQQKLFKPFERAGAEKTGIEGTGIGLVISEQLMEKMGGNIGFTSEEGQGSCFWLEIPLSHN